MVAVLMVAGLATAGSLDDLVQEYIAKLSDKSEDVRNQATYEIGEGMWDAASRAKFVPALAKTLLQDSARVRAGAAFALGSMAGDPEILPAISALEQAAKDPDPDVSREAAKALKKYQAKVKQ